MNNAYVLSNPDNVCMIEPDLVIEPNAGAAASPGRASGDMSDVFSTFHLVRSRWRWLRTQCCVPAPAAMPFTGVHRFEDGVFAAPRMPRSCECFLKPEVAQSSQGACSRSPAPDRYDR